MPDAAEYADRIIRECSEDPDIWATHGHPSEHKLAAIRRRMIAAIDDAIDASTPDPDELPENR